LDIGNRDVGGVASLDNLLRIDGDSSDTLFLAAADGWNGSPDVNSLTGYAIYAVQNVKIAIDQDITVNLS
jgi:hypothetical protein